MKKLLIFILLTFGASWLFGQSNRDLRKIYDRQRQALIEEGWDIVPQPGEEPQDIMSRSDFESTAQTNWGVTLLLPEDLRDRLINECTKPVVVKVFDTGGKCTHDYLKQGQLPGSTFTGESDLEDGHGHATHVAGIIVGDQGLGVLDGLVDKGLITWKPVKVLNNSGSGSFSWIAAAIASESTDNRSLRNRGVYVVCTASLGGGTAKIGEVETALKSDVVNGVIWTVAAGNSSGGPVNYPGNSEYVMGVGSLDNTVPLTHSSFESVGPEIWVGMPGRAINSTYKGNTFASLSGTSMATPFQAALCAIALSKWGDLVADKDAMKAYISKIASDLEAQGKDNFTGYGIDYIRAVLDTKPGVTPPPVQGAPVLVSPKNDASGVSLLPTFIWSGKSTSYTIQVATDPSFTNLTLNQVGSDTTLTLTRELQYSTKYFWRVNGTTSNVTSPWSSVWGFTTLDKPALPIHPARTLVFRLTGSYQIAWNNESGLAFGETGKLSEIENSTYRAKTKRQLKATATETLTITAIDIRIISSTNMAPVDYTNLVANTAGFFKNRGLWLSGNPDYFDAANWSAYFFEMLYPKDGNIFIDVLRIEFKDKNGKTGVLLEQDLRHWKNTP